MKRVIFLSAAAAAVISLSSCATDKTPPAIRIAAASDAAVAGSVPNGPAPASVSWPLMFNNGGNQYTIFEPQCDSWNGHELTARSAVGIRSPGQPESVYGEISFRAITLVDKTRGSAKLANLSILSGDFPTAHAKTYLAILREQFPKRAQPIPLEHLESSLAPVETRPQPEALNNNPPKIIIATRPAILVYVDGPPVWRPVLGTKLMRVLNTRMLLLKDPSGTCYLHLLDGYLQAASLHGRWAVASHPPAGADIAEKVVSDTGQTDLLAGEPDPVTGKAPSLSTSATPDVFVATTPSELITFNGEPQFAPIPGTELLYASNTSANVFKLLSDQQNYLLISGRWYRALSLNGPWQFVPGNELPGDFANIPDDSPKENVKASVPETRQAEEALIANSIPQSTAVARDTRMFDPHIDGAPQLAPIEDTLLHYVANSSTPIIEVNSESWYACQNGEWFTATSVNGPWTVAAYIPPAIYSIPVTSPLHYLTYVRIYGSSNDVVYEGYTPGYFGTEVADDGVVVYGTGYDYPCWVGGCWYAGPMTWGWGYDCCWNPWWGWGFDCGFGWGCWGFGWCDFFPPWPCWGGFGHFHHHDHDGGGQGWHPPGRWAQGNTGANLYHRLALTTRSQIGRPGFASGYGHAYNSRTGQIAAGEPGRVRSVSGAAWNSGRWSGLAASSRPFAGQSYGRHPGGYYGTSRGFQNSRGFSGYNHGYGEGFHNGGFFHSFGGYFGYGGGHGGGEDGHGGEGGRGGGGGGGRGGGGGGGGGGHGR